MGPESDEATRANPAPPFRGWPPWITGRVSETAANERSKYDLRHPCHMLAQAIWYSSVGPRETISIREGNLCSPWMGDGGHEASFARRAARRTNWQAVGPSVFGGGGDRPTWREAEPISQRGRGRPITPRRAVCPANPAPSQVLSQRPALSPRSRVGHTHIHRRPLHSL